jgi:TM2 domain-containing membrane protein YozV
MSLNLADSCFLICGLDCFYTGSAKNYGSCPLNNILSSGYLANPCLCFWTTNFIHWLAVHWISSCPVDNLIQWIILSSILNNRALVFLCGSCYSIFSFLCSEHYCVYLCPLSVCQCIVCPSIYLFWSPLW